VACSDLAPRGCLTREACPVRLALRAVLVRYAPSWADPSPCCWPPGGVPVAVLWFDLMFDRAGASPRRRRRRRAYGLDRRLLPAVTIEVLPANRAGWARHAGHHRGPVWCRWWRLSERGRALAALLLAALPVALAATRVLPERDGLGGPGERRRATDAGTGDLARPRGVFRRMVRLSPRSTLLSFGPSDWALRAQCSDW